jgi:hypothetical protein
MRIIREKTIIVLILVCGIIDSMFSCAGGDAVSNPTIIRVTGYVYDGSDINSAVIWENKNRKTLPVFDSESHSMAAGLYTNGEDIYISGFHTKNGMNIPCYRKNGDRIDLSYFGAGIATGLYLFKGDVYTSGSTFNESYQRVPCFWKNELRTYLPIPNEASSGGMAWSINVR